MIERRYLLGGLALGGAVIGAPMLFAKSARPKAAPGWQLSDAEWKKRRSPLQYRVLREAATAGQSAAELGYRHCPWFFYLDSSLAEPDTAGSTVDSVSAHAPGLSYDYGPGWIYLEYLTQDGFVDRNGQVGEGDFDALYLSIDFYL